MKKTKAFEQTDFDPSKAHQRDSQRRLWRLTALPAHFHNEARTTWGNLKKQIRPRSSFDECSPVLGLPGIESVRAVRGTGLQLPFIFEKVQRFW